MLGPCNRLVCRQQGLRTMSDRVATIKMATTIFVPTCWALPVVTFCGRILQTPGLQTMLGEVDDRRLRPHRCDKCVGCNDVRAVVAPGKSSDQVHDAGSIDEDEAMVLKGYSGASGVWAAVQGRGASGHDQIEEGKSFFFCRGTNVCGRRGKNQALAVLVGPSFLRQQQLHTNHPSTVASVPVVSPSILSLIAAPSISLQSRPLTLPSSPHIFSHHGRSLLVLAHHLLPQVLFTLYRLRKPYADFRLAESWYRLVRPKYALNAVNQGVTALGIKATNGIVLATEKKSSSPLIDAASGSKISLITPNIGTVYAGMGPDYRILVDKARKVSHTNYKRVYNEYPPTRILVQDVARVMQEATQSGGVRPYGVSLLVAGWDDGIEPETEAADAGDDAEKKAIKGKTGGILKGGPSLYQVDPSGSYFPWKATAIGKSATSAKTFLEKRYTDGLELEDAIHIALLTLKETIEGEMNGDTIEIGIVGAPADHLLGVEGVEGAQGPRFRKLSSQEIEDYLTTQFSYRGSDCLVEVCVPSA
ncbi:putative proteasome subunit alpha type-2, partial [Aureobasidium sp. EXF-3399]